MIRGVGGRLFLAFRIPGYRWIWGSSFFAASGNMTSMLVQGWLILKLTNSPLMVGLTSALGGIANLVFGPFGGVLADRLSRRKILISCQIVSASFLLLLGLLIVAGLIQVWHILLVSSVQGMIRGIQMPARNSLMYDLVGRQAVMNAMAGLYMAFHVAGVIGSFAAGFSLTAFGAGPVFVGISILVFLAALLLTRLPCSPQTTALAGSFWQNFRQGVGFALHDRPTRTVMSVILLTEGLGFSTRSMLPVVTRDVFHAGPAVLGLLYTLWEVGGVIAAITVSYIGNIRPKGWLFMGAALGFGAFLVLFSFSRSLPLSLILIMLAGGLGVTYDTMAITLLQTLSPDVMRGRIMGLYSVLISGVSLGALVMGTLANVWGVTVAITIGGSTVSLNALRVAPVARLMGKRSAAAEQAVSTTTLRKFP